MTGSGTVIIILCVAVCFSSPIASPESEDAFKLEHPSIASRKRPPISSFSKAFLFYFNVFGVSQTLLETYAVSLDLDTRRREKSKEDPVDAFQPQLEEISQQLRQLIETVQTFKDNTGRSSTHSCENTIIKTPNQLMKKRKTRRVRKRRQLSSTKIFLQFLWNAWYYMTIPLALYAFYGDSVGVFDPENKSSPPLDELLDEIKESFNDFQNSFQEVKILASEVPCSKSFAKRSLLVLDTPFLISWEFFNIGLSIFGAYADYLSFEPEDPDPLEKFGNELEEFKEELMEFTKQIEIFTEKMDPYCREDRVIVDNAWKVDTTHRNRKKRSPTSRKTKVTFPFRKAYSVLQNWTQISGVKERLFIIWEYINIMFVLFAFIADSRSAYLYTLEEEDSTHKVTGEIDEIKELLDDIGKHVKRLANA